MFAWEHDWQCFGTVFAYLFRAYSSLNKPEYMKRPSWGPAHVIRFMGSFIVSHMGFGLPPSKDGTNTRASYVKLMEERWMIIA
jgi:hypothetical protein